MALRPKPLIGVLLLTITGCLFFLLSDPNSSLGLDDSELALLDTFTDTQPYGTIQWPMNNETGFTIPELLQLCVSGSSAAISRFYAFDGPQTQLIGLGLANCFPIEIVLHPDARNMDSCSDIVHLIYYSAARLSSDYSTNKLMACPILFTPSPQLLETHQHTLLPFAHRILCKTKSVCTAAQALIASTPKASHIETKYTSHATPDITLLISSPQDQDYSKIFHKVDSTSPSFTTTLLNCWSKHPTWPVLTIASAYPLTETPAPNIVFVPLTPLQPLWTAQATSGIHILPSHISISLHTLNTARAASALTITLDSSLVREIFTDTVSGILQVLAMSVPDRRKLGKKAREAYDRDTAIYVEFVRGLRKEADTWISRKEFKSEL
ncbi:hypothetical protein BCR33DRAFT_718821 [Rhizoclosmatium globosum]|uniref:Glycosyltransferase family 1 protein n=1 Tax=Rhizoclosmatium globosum TaxID=329046 RepID=A0A1Y2C3Q3_9FUNG|nr:hypothetical protein BCR33DRAFT_718821 [Rhizoclosmatium globosum]|eukprot:ORY41683.1 hypothetical protein BCR33DRAFT_718821 [Rhizoclosmatium globosum]